MAEIALELASQRLHHHEIKKKDINLIPSQPKNKLMPLPLKTIIHIKQKKSLIILLKLRRLISTPIYQSTNL